MASHDEIANRLSALAIFCVVFVPLAIFLVGGEHKLAFMGFSALATSTAVTSIGYAASWTAFLG